ncbi:hypothetical protein SAMN05421770_103437 [Granulicella rosea]|uniref:Outer membrane lipoprotein-sorting protein n=1 Tax=Granulicella rosea TaxID=474952 RepID=A0A239J4M1_9BACT|nr:hypothetical protein [Granulicella rosea]SNT00797.1 hypothetical protein SAMN05421770_103437 [Granulicella rosea]
MKILKHLGPVAAFALFPAATALATPPTGLDAVIAQMDAASKTFKSAQADFTKDIFEKIVSDHTIQKGSLYVERKGADTYMGLNITGAGATTVEYTPGTVRQYQPGLKCFNTYSSLNKSSVESFLTLGFGGSGTELKKNWTITDQGSETLSDGKSQVKVEKLDLVGKDQSVRNNFTHVTLWIDPVRGISLKQVFYTPSGDTQTATYTNIRMGGTIDKKPYAIGGGACHK